MPSIKVPYPPSLSSDTFLLCMIHNKINMDSIYDIYKFVHNNCYIKIDMVCVNSYYDPNLRIFENILIGLCENTHKYDYYDKFDITHIVTRFLSMNEAKHIYQLYGQKVLCNENGMKYETHSERAGYLMRQRGKDPISFSYILYSHENEKFYFIKNELEYDIIKLVDNDMSMKMIILLPIVAAAIYFLT